MLKTADQPDPNAPAGRAALELASRLKACDLGMAYAERIGDIGHLWANNPRAEFFFWYWAKAMGKDARRDPRFRMFCNIALIPYHHLFTDQDSQSIARTINAAKPRGPAEWSAIAVFSVARAREYSRKRFPWLAAVGTSNWLCAASTALAMVDGKDGAGAFNAEQARQAEILRGLFDDPLQSLVPSVAAVTETLSTRQ